VSAAPVFNVPNSVTPNAETVGAAWLKALLIAANPITAPGCGIALPESTDTWRDYGFVQVRTMPGVPSDLYTRQRHSVFQVDAWACNAKGNVPPWNLAGRAATLVQSATETAPGVVVGGWTHGRTVVLPTPYRSAVVQSGYLLGDPYRVENDPSGYARFTATLELDWAVA